MNGEIFEVKGEIVELKREKQAIAATARLTESDIQRKLEVRDFKIPPFLLKAIVSLVCCLSFDSLVICVY